MEKLVKLRELNKELLTAEVIWHNAWMLIYESSYDKKLAVVDHQAKKTREYETYKSLLLERHALLIELQSISTDPISGSPSD